MYVLAGWVLANHEEQFVLWKIGSEPGMSLTFRFSLTIEGDLTWKLHVLGVLVPPHSCICGSTPDTLSTVCDVQSLLTKVNSSVVCTGNPDFRFTEMVVKRKGVIMDRAGMQPVTSTCTCILLVPCVKHQVYMYLSRPIMYIVHNRCI